ncbi:MAG: prepilin-type N-terminal cleavage/methylation domain-containing protein [Verrucomicrobiota bacterium]|nr:prepilin-type N-terminal cleavage/methylation domain-containing protein [Limisphaera sp.]MDW8381058.1 prepilin-type N-terminal cleavage/methylation domain-containing protein [Verrucomicrobiota bacterium]
MNRSNSFVAFGTKLGPGHPSGFTLLELLVILTIISLLAAWLVPALARARLRAQRIVCIGQLHQLGVALHLYAGDHEDELPRSQHSAFAQRQHPWGAALAPYLGSTFQTWTNLWNSLYRCPADRRRNAWSYGLNVYFELGPEDDYRGKPQTWRRFGQIRRPSETILMAENNTEADHFMANYWDQPEQVTDVARRRHGERANYLYADGHIRTRCFESTYHPARRVDQWHPEPESQL